MQVLVGTESDHWNVSRVRVSGNGGWVRKPARPPLTPTRPVTRSQTPSCLRRFTSLYCPCCDALSLHMQAHQVHPLAPNVSARQRAAVRQPPCSLSHLLPVSSVDRIWPPDRHRYATLGCPVLSLMRYTAAAIHSNGSLSTHREIARSLSSHPRIE